MKDKYWIEIKYSEYGAAFMDGWRWSIKSINGKGGAESKAYKNKAQCRNAATNFAEYAGLEVRE